jgi:DNA-binding beta-propeller fold protein YncE
MEKYGTRVSRCVLGVAAAAIACASGAFAAPVLEYQATLDVPRGEERSSLPVAVSVNPVDGGQAGCCEVCVTDAVTASGFVFDRSNVRVFNTGLIARLVAPVDVTVLSTGGFVCTDGLQGGGRIIRRLNFFGEPMAFEPEVPPEGWAPEHLLVTRDGNYVTTDPTRGRLAKHDARTGALLWERAVDALQSGEILGLGKPAEAPDGRLYLPLGGERRVAVLSADGESLESFGVPGTGAGRLSFPVGVAFCPDGNVAVLDRMRGVVLFYSSLHVFQAESGQPGGGATDFYYPNAIAAAPDGRVYVAQGFLGRVYVFRYVVTEAVRFMTINQSCLAEARRVRAFDSHREGEGCL